MTNCSCLTFRKLGQYRVVIGGWDALGFIQHGKLKCTSWAFMAACLPLVFRENAKHWIVTMVLMANMFHSNASKNVASNALHGISLELISPIEISRKHSSRCFFNPVKLRPFTGFPFIGDQKTITQQRDTTQAKKKLQQNDQLMADFFYTCNSIQ
ncbi:hypothetical protein CSK29544_02108 [Cronobacter sakazakii]|nr:hypothetical protein CSK29544_02108 [Cronobacter sakazakii]